MQDELNPERLLLLWHNGGLGVARDEGCEG